MVLVTEVLRLEKFWAYPYNSVRNQAVARTRTKLLVLLDVDFLLRKGAPGGRGLGAPGSVRLV